MESKQELAEQVIALAQEVIGRGVLMGQMSPDNPQHQIIVVGSMVVLAAVSQGISMDDAIARVAGITLDDLIDKDNDVSNVVDFPSKPKSSGGGGHPGQYL